MNMMLPSPVPMLPMGEDPDSAVPVLKKRTKRAFIYIGLLVALFLLSAIVFKVDGAVIASGQVAVESRVKLISHPTGGVLEELLVRDGSRVKGGDVLMRFNTSVSGPSSRFTDSGLDQLVARGARLEAERDNQSSVRWPAGFATRQDPSARTLREREATLFRIRRDERLGTRALLNERIVQFDQLIVSYNAQIDAAQRQMALIGPELDGLRGLYAKQLVTINRLNALERTAIELEGQIASYQANISQTRARIAETREQILNADQTVRSQAGAELAEVVRLMTDQQIRKAQATDTFTRSVVRAPQSGVIDKLQFNTIGSAVPAGQPLAQIVPDADTLIVEAKVNPGDIDEVLVGQAARVRLSTLNREMTPELTGKVTFVSAEAAVDDRTGFTYYRINVELDADEQDTRAAQQLKAGMPVEIFLSTGNRSILSYLVKPLIDHISHSFRS